jgi:hypothetical protein
VSRDRLDDDFIECRTYTHARRFPLVIGHIGGYHLPAPYTPAQLAVGGGAFGLLLLTRHLWGVLGSLGNLLVLLAVPLTLAWMVRHMKIEGRSTFRALAGFGRYLSRSPRGRLHGRPVRQSKPRVQRPVAIFVMEAAVMPVAEGITPWIPDAFEQAPRRTKG